MATDETGARLPGVAVTVTSNTTGISRTLVTDADGSGLAVSLQPGSYSVAAQLNGFATVTLEQVTVALNQRANVTILLKVAPVAEQITVTGESSHIVDTSKTDVSSLVNERSVQELPINERNPLRFILTLPGTTIQRTATGSGYSFGGSRARNNSSILDGADNNDDSVRGFLAQPSLDAVKEFQVMTSNFTAEYGRASGGVVNTILKSGTNQVRGTGFYHRTARLRRTTSSPTRIRITRRASGRTSGSSSRAAASAARSAATSCSSSPRTNSSG